MRLTKIQRRCLRDAQLGLRCDIGFAIHPSGVVSVKLDSGNLQRKPWLAANGNRYSRTTVRSLSNRGLLDTVKMEPHEVLAGCIRYYTSDKGRGL